MISKDDLPKAVDDWIARCDRVTREWKDSCRMWYDLVAGKQWTEDEEAEMRELLRPIMTFNRIGTFIDTAQGLEISNRQEVQFLPREMGDVKVNEILTGAVEWAREKCDAEDEDSDAFYDLLVSGMGWTETRMDYEADPEGMIVVERIDPLEMRWDVACKKRNLSSAEYVIHMRKYKKDEAKEKWPELSDSMPEDDLSGRNHSASNAWKYESNQSDDTPNNDSMVTIAHVQWKERVPFVKIATPQGIKDIQEDQWKQVSAQFPGIKAVQYRKTVYKRAFVAGSQVLGDIENAPSQSGFTFKCMTGKRDRNANTWYGLVKPMVDPQRWSNKFISSLLQDFSTNGKGIMAEQDAFVSWQETEQNWTNPAKIVKLRAGAIGNNKIMPKPSGIYPVGLESLLSQSVIAFRDVTGINLELMGLAEAQQAGVLEAHRKQAGMTILSWCFDAMRRYRKEQGRVLVEFIQDFISDGRLVRISAQGAERFIPLIKNAETMEFDVIVDESPNSVNQKERTWAVMQSLLPLMVPMGLMPPADMVDYIPIPEALATAWKEELKNNTPKDQQIAMLNQQIQSLTQQLQSPMMQAQLQSMSVKDFKVQTDAQLNLAKIDDMGSPLTHVERMAEVNKKAVDTGISLGGNNGN